jgi:hypothetical protein
MVGTSFREVWRRKSMRIAARIIKAKGWRLYANSYMSLFVVLVHHKESRFSGKNEIFHRSTSQNDRPKIVCIHALGLGLNAETRMNAYNPRILVIGAGVKGSAVVAKLVNAGLDATVLARGKRYGQIRDGGDYHRRSVQP